MALVKLFKRKSSRRAGSHLDKNEQRKSVVNPATDHSSRTGGTERDSDSSIASGSRAAAGISSKAKELESLATRKQWAAALSLIAESHADDWYTVDNTSQVESGDDEFHEEVEGNETTKGEDKPASTKPMEMAGGDSSMFLQRKTLTPLHLLLVYKPPMKIVEELITILHDKFGVFIPEECLNHEGKTPLHVAAEHGCDGDIAKRFLIGPSLLMPAVIQDDQKRLPLHWACCTPFVKPTKRGVGAVFQSNPKELAKWNKRTLIDALLNEYPEGALCKDIHGKTPLDYAKENCKSLQSLSIRRLERECAFWAKPIVKKSTASIAGGAPDTSESLAVTPAAADVLPEDIEFDEEVYAKFCEDEASVGYDDIIDAITEMDEV